MGTDNFCLRWNDFESNISTSFVEIRESQEFFDVVLSCEFGEEQIEAHKVVLAACSPFFRRILARNPHKKPIIYLKGIDYENLAAILNFMYHGEVNVSQEDLPSFLRVAEELAVKGLTDNGSGNQSNSNSKSHLNHHSSGNNSLANQQQQQLLNQSVLQQSNTLINSLLAQTNKSSSQNGATNNGSNFSPSALAAQKVQRQRRQHPNLDLLLSGMNKRPIGSGINNNTTQNTLLNKTNLLNAGVGGGNGGGRNNNTNMTNMLLNSVLANNNLTQPPVQKKSRQQSEQSKQQDAVISLANSILLQQRQNNAAQAAASSTPPVMGTPSATTVSSSSSLTAVSSAASSLPFGFNIKPISPSKLKTDMQSAPIPSLAQTLATGGVGSIGGDDDMTDQEELILDVPNQDELVVNDMEDEEEMNGTVVRQNNTGDSGLGGGQGSNPDDIIADDDSESGHSMGGQPVDPSEYLDSGEAVLTVGNGESLLNSIKSESNMGRTQILNPEISESDGGKDSSTLPLWVNSEPISTSAANSVVIGSASSKRSNSDDTNSHSVSLLTFPKNRSESSSGPGQKPTIKQEVVELNPDDINGLDAALTSLPPGAVLTGGVDVSNFYQKIVNVKSEDGKIIGQLENLTNPSVLAQQHGPSNPNCYLCKVCKYRSSQKIVMQRHVEAKHYSPGYQCTHCPLIFKTKHKMNIHLRNLRMQAANDAALLSVSGATTEATLLTTGTGGDNGVLPLTPNVPSISTASDAAAILSAVGLGGGLNGFGTGGSSPLSTLIGPPSNSVPIPNGVVSSTPMVVSIPPGVVSSPSIVSQQQTAV